MGLPVVTHRVLVVHCRHDNTTSTYSSLSVVAAMEHYILRVEVRGTRTNWVLMPHRKIGMQEESWQCLQMRGRGTRRHCHTAPNFHFLYVLILNTQTPQQSLKYVHKISHIWETSSRLFQSLARPEKFNLTILFRSWH